MIPKVGNGQMWQVTTSAAALNGLALFEILCWRNHRQRSHHRLPSLSCLAQMSH